MRRDETRGEKKDLRPPAGEQYGVRLKLCAGCMGVVTWSPLHGGLAGADRVAPHLASRTTVFSILRDRYSADAPSPSLFERLLMAGAAEWRPRRAAPRDRVVRVLLVEVPQQRCAKTRWSALAAGGGPDARDVARKTQ